MIETKVEGSPSQVRTAETWLRDTLAGGVSDAADEAGAGRRSASGEWDGISGAAYMNLAKTLVEFSDDHAKRVKRAATAFGDFATHLQGVKDEMGRIRGRATAGGLTVSGTQIAEPPAAPGYDDLPAGSSDTERSAWEQDKAAHEKAVAKIDLYDELAEDVGLEYERHQDWIDANLRPALSDAEEDGSVHELVLELQSAWAPFMVGSSFTFRELQLEKKAGGLVDAAKPHQREARRLAQKARQEAKKPKSQRTPGSRERVERLQDARDAERARGTSLLDEAGNLRKAAKFLGPIGWVADIGFGIKDIADGESPGKVILSTLGGAAAAAGVVAGAAALGITAPAWGTALAAGAVAVGVGYGIKKGWDALPDGFTDGVDNALSDAGGAIADGAGAVGDAVSDGWDTVTGWI